MPNRPWLPLLVLAALLAVPARAATQDATPAVSNPVVETPSGALRGVADGGMGRQVAASIGHPLRQRKPDGGIVPDGGRRPCTHATESRQSPATARRRPGVEATGRTEVGGPRDAAPRIGAVAAVVG